MTNKDKKIMDYMCEVGFAAIIIMAAMGLKLIIGMLGLTYIM